jgi:phytoene synthase
MPAATESHPARYLALLYSPAAQRSVLETLFGIEREVSESLRPGLEHQVAHARLQWWREESERAAGGRPVHPLTRALVQAVGGPIAGVSGLVDVAQWDLAGATFETRRELIAYCERWAAAMIQPLVGRSAATVIEPLVAQSAGTPSSEAAAQPGSATRANNWRTLGAAIRELELLSDVAREAHYGRLRVPLDELDGSKADPSALAKPPWPAALANLLRARHKSLRDEITRALRDVEPAQQPALRGLLVWAALAWRGSQRSERALPDQLRPGRFDATADAWFAWRIARRATFGRFRLN